MSNFQFPISLYISLMETALEKVLTSFYKDGMISYMATHPEDFEEAIQLAITEKQPYSWRAAWLLWSCMEENDPRFTKHIQTLIDSISTKKDGHQRELIKILYNMELNEEYEGFLFNLCVNIWEKIGKNPSVRYTAFKYILKVVQKYPELSQEIHLYTQNQYLDSLSPGVKRSLFRMVKEVNLKLDL